MLLMHRFGSLKDLFIVVCTQKNCLNDVILFEHPKHIHTETVYGEIIFVRPRHNLSCSHSQSLNVVEDCGYSLDL